MDECWTSVDVLCWNESHFREFKNANLNSSEHYNIHAVYLIYTARSNKYLYNILYIIIYKTIFQSKRQIGRCIALILYARHNNIIYYHITLDNKKKKNLQNPLLRYYHCRLVTTIVTHHSAANLPWTAIRTVQCIPRYNLWDSWTSCLYDIALSQTDRVQTVSFIIYNTPTSAVECRYYDTKRKTGRGTIIPPYIYGRGEVVYCRWV